MRRGIVMEIKDNYAIILEEGGSYQALNIKANMIIGERIAFDDQDCYQGDLLKAGSGFKRQFLAAAMFLLVIGLTVFASGIFQNQTFAVVSIDVNPSFTLEINEHEKILNVQALNEDASKLDLKAIEGQSLKEGLIHLYDSLKKEGYLRENSPILIGLALLEKDHNGFAQETRTTVEDIFIHEKILFVQASKAAAQEAEAKGLSVGRYEIARRLHADEESISKLTVKEIEDLSETEVEDANDDKDIEDEIEDHDKDKNQAVFQPSDTRSFDNSVESKSDLTNPAENNHQERDIQKNEVKTNNDADDSDDIKSNQDDESINDDDYDEK